MEKIGVVTVTYNSENVIKPFLENLYAQSFTNFNLYIIDNASTDSTLDILNNLNDNRICQIRNENNLGVAAANNIGIKKALLDKCTHVLIANNDIEFNTKLLENMLSSFKKNNCGLVTPKIMYYNDKNKIWYAGGGFKKSNGYLPYHNGFNQNQTDLEYLSCYVDYAPTCCLLVKSEVFKEIGLMDEKYFVYFDDTDFMYRIKKNKKYKLFYDSHYCIFHKVGSLTKSIPHDKENNFKSDFFLKQNTRNHVYFLRKNISVYNYMFCFFLFIKNNLRFFFSSRIKKDISTFLLINKSYFKGWFL